MELKRDHIQDSVPAEKPQKPEPLMVPPPFPQRLAQSKKEKEDKSIMELFRKVEVNIPLLEAIKQVPRYAKFLKELCTNKHKLTGNEWVSVGENVSAILQRKLPPKCRDQGMFSIPCKIGNIGISKAMCDLGASINVFPLSVYTSLGLGPLTSTGVIIQLADRSIVYPEGVLEDVLVQVNGLIFPADFFVIDMENDSSSNSSDILLGRPFLSTAKAKIDVHSGSLTLEFDGEVVKFNVYDAMKHTEEVMKFVPIKLSRSESTLLPSILQALKLELKKLPEHLKYTYLGDGETLPVIISSMLDGLKEEKLIRVLREYREAIGGTIADFQHRDEG
ncbi:hypothetical protein K2173_024560 [Erythroxylum novogranatense]|uniref:Aspartic peptidase DDI1-type domain-containing protein n=1 Tax=Erythroxylum novogranatense TaxID=1862640 RepID=A0AAV8SVY5_9ROSI|nr:hypothetical protein K2173_024560 [Erythroxylum novogranatense]